MLEQDKYLKYKIANESRRFEYSALNDHPILINILFKC